MRQVILAVAIAWSFIGIVRADVIDTVQFEDVNSRSIQGDPANDVFYFNATADYTLFTITWDGIVSPQQDISPGSGGIFPSWGVDLRARMTHEASGAYADIQLGEGGTFSPDTPFAGTNFGLAGTHVLTDDSFRIEFYEDIDDDDSDNDPTPDPDAIWSNITFAFDDEPPGNPAAFFLDDTTGAATWHRAWFDPSTHRYVPSDKGTEVCYHWYELTTDTTDYYSFELVHAGEDFATYLFLFNDNGFDPEDTSYPGIMADDEDEISAASGDLSILAAGETYHLIVTGYDNADYGSYALVVDGPDAATVTMALHGLEDADFNRDGAVDTIDLSIWNEGYGTWQQGERGDGDANGDQDVDGADFLVWQRQYEATAVTLAADFNADGTVDQEDVLLWSAGYGMTGQAHRGDGDADLDSDVDGSDFLIWQQQFGMSLAPAVGVVGTAVPEPGSLALLGALLLGIGWIRFLD